MTKVQEVGALIRTMSLDEIKQVNEMIRNRYATASSQAASNFSHGDEVIFADKYGRPIRGKIVKIMPKNIRVVTSDGTTWRVSPPLLKKA